LLPGGRRAAGRPHRWRGDSDHAKRADKRPASSDGVSPEHWPSLPTRLRLVHPMLLFLPAFPATLPGIPAGHAKGLDQTAGDDQAAREPTLALALAHISLTACHPERNA